MSKVIQKKFDIASNKLKPAHMTDEERRTWAIEQLQQKAKELGSIPRKADFADIEKIRIKAALGPWPRALEAAGLKKPKNKPPK